MNANSPDGAAESPKVPTRPGPVFTNHLIHESSPYLLQHAHNPVDWYPWGEAAFALARKQDKPIFLSIGYSTCHWCHVMEHESFEDPDMAALLNDAFVCIKVDREERPDIDSVYMAVCQALTRSGGWPLTIIMTPDRKPFYAGTYIPKESRFGRTGLRKLVPAIQRTWKENREQLVGRADTIQAHLQQANAIPPVADAPGRELLDQAFNDLAADFDSRHGGFGQAPKFPTPHNILFLLRYWTRTGNRKALDMAGYALRAIRNGGIYDQVGLGLHRYSTTPDWLVPHFEKMIYDQAMYTLACLEMFQATRDPRFAEFAQETLTYVLRDMTDPGGGFYSAEDADSEGVEGKFYLWTADEIRRALGPDADFAIKVFGVKDRGNFRGDPDHRIAGANILHLTAPSPGTGGKADAPAPESTRRFDRVRRKLLEVRGKRIRPLRDDKVLTDWNGLMIGTLARAGRVLGKEQYTRAANRAADFIHAKLRRKDGRLLHRWRGGVAGIDAFLDDYAFLAWGLTELYETTYDPTRLETARNLVQTLLDHFEDRELGGFRMTADDSPGAMTPARSAYDGAIPSGNSMALLDLLRTGAVTGDARFTAAADRVVRAFGKQVRQMPRAYVFFLVGFDYALGPSSEVVIAASNRQAQDTRRLLDALNRAWSPNKTVLLKIEGAGGARLDALAPWTEAYGPIKGRAAAYVCRNRACNLPVSDPDRMLELLTAPHGKVPPPSQ